jgi:uroporphyrinogen III methyltransferase/synthase
MIEILPPDSWQELDDAIASLADYDWVVFASVNAANAFGGRLERVWIEDKPKFATIGPATTAALKSYGLKPSYQAREFVADSFVEHFPDFSNIRGKRILWPKTNIGRMLIADQLQAAGAEVHVVNCYKTALPADSQSIADELLALLKSKSVDVILVASAQTARNLRTILNTVASEADIQSLLSNVKILAIGPQTAMAAREHLFNCHLQAAEYTIDGMIETLLHEKS